MKLRPRSRSAKKNDSLAANCRRVRWLEKLEDRSVIGSMLVAMPGGLLADWLAQTAEQMAGLPTATTFDPFTNRRSFWSPFADLPSLGRPTVNSMAPSETGHSAGSVARSETGHSAGSVETGHSAGDLYPSPINTLELPDADWGDPAIASASFQAFQSLAMADNSGFGSSAGLRLHVDPGLQIPSPGSDLGSSYGSTSTTPAFDPSPDVWNWNPAPEGEAADQQPAPSPQQTPTDNPTGPEPDEPGESPTPMNSPPTVSLIRFPDDLATAGWQAGESGGTEPGIGTVTAGQGAVTLCEGNSFLVTLAYTFETGDWSNALSFAYTDLFLDPTDTGSINDAFEVALVDTDGFSLVPTFAPQRDAFFNISEGLPAALGDGVTLDNGRVTVDLTGVPVGETATLIFRLVNNDSDTGSCVRLTGVGGLHENSPPELDAIGDKSVDEETLLTFTVSASDPDLPPQTLTFSASGLPDGATFDPLSRRFSWTPDESQGPDTCDVTFTVSDGEFSDSETITITVREVNLRPILDPIGDPFVDEQTLLTFNVSASDPDLPPQTLTFSTSDLPLGAAFDPTTRQFSWTPAKAQAPGEYPVTFIVSDGELSDSETITITVFTVNVAPQLNPILPLQAAEGQTVTLNATFTDPDADDSHTATIDWGDGIISQAAVAPSPGGGVISATHVYADNGQYEIRVTVTDAAEAAASATTTATVTNVPPTLTARLTYEAVLVGGSYQVGAVIHGQFTDPGFDRPEAGTVESFTVGIDWGDGVVQYVDADVVQGSPGVATAGQFTAHHLHPTGGVFDVAVQVCDDDGGCDDAAFRYGVTVIDIKPAIRKRGGNGYSTSLPEGKIPVVMYGAPGFDATKINPATVQFFPGGGSELAQKLKYSDIAPKDRIRDAIGHFSTWTAKIQPEDVVGWVTGELADGTPFVGVDLIGVNPASARIPFAYAEVRPGMRGTKFFVVDGFNDRVYRYDPEGQHEGSIAAGVKVTDPRGIASNVAGDMLWVIDGKTRAVTVVQPGGKLRGTWKPAGLKQPEDIAVHEKDIWIVDAANRRVYGYYGAATRTKGSAKISTSFPLDAANTRPTGLVTDGQQFWVTDDAAASVFVYDRHGSLLGSWQLDHGNAAPSGITRNPAGGHDLWVVDRDDRHVYHYALGGTLHTGQHAADATFILHATNAAPEGLADPPVDDHFFAPDFSANLLAAEGEAPPAPPQTELGDSLLDADGQVTFTTSDDFLAGTLFNVNVTEVPGQLTLNPPGEIQTYPFIWIANTGEGTVSKFNTRTGEELGRYRTGPEWDSPTVIAVTEDGDAWIAKSGYTDTGQVVKIFRTGGIDRNGNGIIDTSFDANGDGRIDADETLPWDDDGDGLPDDERIAMVLRTGWDRETLDYVGQWESPRALTLDQQGRLWVGMAWLGQYEVYDGKSGELLQIVPTNEMPIGAAIDATGNLWSTNYEYEIDRIDTVTGRVLESVPIDFVAHWITVDDQGIVWASSGYGDGLLRFDPVTQTQQYYEGSFSADGGIAVDRNGNVWAGSHWDSILTKFVFAPDRTTLLEVLEIPVSDWPISATLDADGFIWTVCDWSGEAWKIDPATNTVVPGWPITTGEYPFSYGDTTGANRVRDTGTVGTWTEVIDGQQNGTVWGAVVVDSTTTPANAVELLVRASDERSLLVAVPWTRVKSGQLLPDIRGQFIEVQVRLTAPAEVPAPSLQAVTVAAIDPPNLHLASPANEVDLSVGQTVLLTGTASAMTQVGPIPTPVPNRIVAVLINGTGVEVLDAGGNFFTQVDVLPGENVFHVTAIDAYGQTAETTVTVFGSQDLGGHIDLLFDVSPSFAPLYARTSFDERQGMLFAELAIHNVGQYPADNPFYVGVRNISDPRVTVRDFAGTTRDGMPYYDFSPTVPGRSLDPESITGFVNAVFHNPQRIPFTYELVFLAKPNSPPAFTSVPVIEPHAGRTYAYEAQATDPDGDPLTYAILAGPQFMTVDPTTGQVNWLPAESDLGVHPVILQVEDGRGGRAEQRYFLAVTETPPNRPPYFVSVPVTEAQFGQDYVYDARVIDPDLDSLTYSLVQHPEGMSIDSTSGVVRWEPSMFPIRDHHVTVQVVDGCGGLAEQIFAIRVNPDPQNQSPVFVSVPPTSIAVRDDQPVGQFRYEAIAIDPDGDPIRYELLDGPDGMTIDAATGLVSWDVPPDFLHRNSLQVSDGDFFATDWTHSAFYGGIGGAAYAPRSTTGGNPGAHQRITTTLDAASSTEGNVIYTIHRYKPVSVDPADFGAILSLSYSEDIRQISGYGQSAGLLVFQDGRVYFGPSQNTTAASVWTSRGFENLIARDFRRFNFATGRTEAVHPDFSQLGGPIQFGFYRGIGNAIGSGGFSGTTGIDNWHVTVTPATDVSVKVRAEDRRGGHDIQEFDVTSTQAARLQGAVFHDVNRDGAWQESGGLVVNTATRFGLLVFDVDTGAFRYPFFLTDPSSRFSAITFAPDGTLYATRASSKELLCVPVNSGEIQVLAESGPLQSPYGIAVGPDGMVYVGDEVSNNVLRFHPETGAFLGVFAQHSGIQLPQDLEFGPNGDLYVLGSLSRTIHRFDGQNGTFKSSFLLTPSDLGNSMAFGPDGLIYVSGVAENWVKRYQPTTGQLVGTFIAAGSGGLRSPEDLVFGPDGNLYVTSSATNQVLMYDGVTGAFVRALGTPELSVPWRIAVSPISVNETEGGVEGWTVFIDANRNGRLDDDERSTVTDANGRFVFENVSPGENWLVLQGQPGWQRTAPPTETHRIFVSPAENRYRVDFGVAQGTDPLRPNTAPGLFDADTLQANVNQMFVFRPFATDVDGDPLTFSLPMSPTGMTLHPTLGTIVWQPTSSQIGFHQFVVKVDDGHGGVAVERFTVEVIAPNIPPVITSSPPSIAVVDLPLVYQVLAQDAEGDRISFRLENEPAGMVIDADTGRLTWTPAVDQLDVHTLTVVASDARGGVTTQAMTIEVVATAPNNPPVITSQPRLRARAGQPYAYAVEAADPNGDPLSYHLDAGPDGMTIDPSGVVRWQPAAELLGTQHPVSIRVDDGRGGSAVRSFGITVISPDANQAPVVVSTPPTAAVAGRTYRYDAVARDPEGDPFIWSLIQAPTGMSIDPFRGTAAWTPAADQTGMQQVVVQVQDVFGAAGTQSFTIDVRAVNRPPSIQSVPPVTADPGQLYVYAVRATDPDGDPLSFRLAVQPDGMTIDQRTGLIRWTPSVPAPSQHTVRIVVEDGYGGIGSQTYTLHVGQQAFNRPPIISSIPAYQAAEGATYRYQVAARDPEGGPVRFELGASPPGMTVEATTGLITWPNAQSGEHTVTVVALDDQDARATQSYLLLVQANQPPVIRAIADRSVLAGAPFAYDVWASDPDGSLFDLTFELAESPVGMTIDARGRILWTTTDADAALSPFIVRPVVTDPLGASAETSFTITVVPDTETPQVELAVSTNLVQQGDAVRVQVRATDNRGVASITLMVGGTPLLLNPVNGYAETSVTMDTPGMIDIVAVAADAAGNQGSSAPWQVRVFDPTDQAWPQVSILALKQLELVDGQPEYRTLAREGDAITEPVTYLANLYATVDDDNLEFWRVDYAKTSEVDLSALHQADPDYTLLAQGTAPYLDANTPIALFDATRLSNDAYVIRVLARDVGGRISTKGLLVGVSGDAKLGNFRLDFTDLTVPLAGIPINITRTYDTLNAGTEGDFGYGWSMAITAADIAETTRPGAEMQPGHRVYLTNPEGKRIGFTYDPELFHAVSLIGYVGTTYTPRFKPDPGVRETLTVKDGSYTRGGVFGSIGAALGNAWNPSQYVLTTPDGTVYDYIQGEGLKKITDANNNVITFTPTAIKHTSGAQIDLIRDARGRIKQIVAPGPAPGDDPIRLNYTYNAARDLVGFTNQMSETVTYGYSTDPRYPHYLSTITDSRDVPVFEAQFDEHGRLTGSTDALKGNVRQEFQPGSFTGTIWDARQNPTTLLYNQRGNVLEETDPLGQTTYYEYTDPRFPDLETKITDRNGMVELRAYDAAGNLKSVTRAAGTAQAVTTNYTYDSRSNLTSIRQAGQPPTVFAYDTAGNLTTITNAIGDVASATYDSQGRQTSFTDFNGHTTTYDYTNGCSSCGSPGVITHPDGTYEITQYNLYGQPMRRDVFEADGTLAESSTTEYDRQGRTIRETFGTGADRTEKRYIYSGNLLDWEIVVHPDSVDASGRLLESPATPVEQRKSSITVYSYDAAGQIIRQTDAEGGVVEFRYDANGNRVLLQDPVGNITTWVYDPLDRMVEERDPFYWVEYVAANPVRFDGLAGDAFLAEIVSANNEPSGASAALNQGAPHVRAFGYDGEGNQTKTIDRNGRRREFDYDPLGRLIEERWYNPDSTLVRTVNSTYDQRGNLQSITDPDSSYTYTYDALNRVTTIDNAGSPDMPHVVLSYAYDAMGNVTRTSDNFGVTVESQYDSRNRLSQRLWYGGDVDPARVDFFYNAIGREERVDRYADLEGVNRVASTDSTYYTTGATRQIIHRNATDEVIAANEYQYDFAGLLAREDRYGQSYPNNDWRADYGYDRTGQLLSATYTGADVIPEQIDEYYRYDANGNRTESYLHSTGYRTGPANQLLTDGTYDFQYDAEGNMVKKTEIATGQVTTFEYDHRNLMVQATIWSSDPSNGGIILHEEQYRYDAHNRRTSIIIDADGAGPEPAEVTNIIYNGDNAWADYNADGERVAQYLFGDQVDQIIAMYRQKQGVTWYGTSKLGTVRDVLDETGTSEVHIEFASFGQPLALENGVSWYRYLFQGREFDPYLNLYHYRSRSYDPVSARFLGCDSLGFEAGDSNLSRFAFNRPQIYRDPYGQAVFAERTILEKMRLAQTEAIRCLGRGVFTSFAEGGVYILLTSLGATPTGPSNVYIGHTKNFVVRFTQHGASGVGGRGVGIITQIPIALSEKVMKDPKKLRTVEQIFIKAFGGKTQLLNTINASKKIYC